MRIAVLAAALAVGCGSSPDPVVARGADVDLASRALNRTFGAATLYVSMGVIVPTSTPENIATALSLRVKSETNGCATATQTGAVLDVDLSAGCTLASAGTVYSGSLHTTVSKTTEVLVSTDVNLVVDGQALTGSFAISTSDGNTFTYGGDLVFGGVHVTAPFLRGGIAAMGATVSAKGTLVGATGTYMLETTGLHQRFGGCYPDDGILQLMLTNTLETWTFASDAPQTGNVMVASGNMSPTTIKLPSRAGCPTAP